MRPARLGLGVLVAFAMALASAPALAAAPLGEIGQTINATPRLTNDPSHEGLKAAPALLQRASLPCQLAGARLIGTAPDPQTHKNSRLYEVACAGGMGFVLTDRGKAAPVQWAACLEEAATDANGKPNPVACRLPGNADETGPLAPFIARTGTGCAIADALGIGHSPEAAYFEVVCQDGRDYVLTTSSPPDPAQGAQAFPCLDPTVTGPITCSLVPPAAQLAFADKLAAQAGKGCLVKERRYVLTTPDSETWYEVACADGKGFMLQALASGRLGQAIGCDEADYVGGGCTLTNGRIAQTQQAGLYSKLAKAAGYDCDVSRYYAFASAPGKDIDELACSNRPDGAIGVFPSGPSGQAMIYNCALSELVGYRCTFSKPAAAWPQLTGYLKKLGKTSCAVSGERVIGVSADKLGYVEVACADGEPGYIISFRLSDMSPVDAAPCALAANINGGCQMPANTRRS